MRLVRVADVESARAGDRIDEGGGREKSGQRRVAAAQALGQDREVGPRPRPVVGGEERPAASRAADDLIIDQQHAEFVADLAHAR